MIWRGDTEVPQLLIKWSQMPVELATWEDKEYIHQQFLLAPTWGQVRSQDGGGGGGVSAPTSSACIGPARGFMGRSGLSEDSVEAIAGECVSR
jgi:hypothetical protein